MKFEMISGPFKLLLLLILPFSVRAQVDVSINPLGMIFLNNYGGGVDVALNEQLSLEGHISFRSGSRLLGKDYTSLPISLLIKYYIRPDKGADGIYFSGFLRHVRRNYSEVDNSSLLYLAGSKEQRLGLGGGTGYKLVSPKGFSFGVDAGIGLVVASRVIGEDGTRSQQDEGIRPILTGRIAVGYRFGLDLKQN